MHIVYFDEWKNNIKYFNGEFYTRPFVDDMVFIDGKLYRVLNITIDYDSNQFLVLVRLAK